MRERGLKLPDLKLFSKQCTVAPHAGAWIETVIFVLVSGIFLSLPMRERGLKLYHPCQLRQKL